MNLYWSCPKHSKSKLQNQLGGNKNDMQSSSRKKLFRKKRNKNMSNSENKLKT